eukprot:CAMPEP_0169424764 /NCGR_PEP_ID=MMETSP1017-20121227/68210_1 /TAXON_ID=342587 /ORGANISM="Karlodinium micrum, Strain CCMP2283" /LENGTH=82 /DNA_ID=CAMNT_0009534561 /DNA_START=607 /DNA_END=852 /DNA_ORIENTATION=+
MMDAPRYHCNARSELLTDFSLAYLALAIVAPTPTLADLSFVCKIVVPTCSNGTNTTTFKRQDWEASVLSRPLTELANVVSSP